MLELAKTLKIPDRSIHFLGWRSDIHALLCAADAFVFPSLFEGFPVSVIEAQASGLTCLVSSNVAKSSAIIQWLVKFLPLSNPYIWIENFVNAKPRLFGDCAKSVAEKGYDVASTIKKFEEVYDACNR
jgi:glycosyltransferase involved in cell wall biosynthesis